ncbi:MAG TPA: SurA N-terminal domain-containing protein [Nevskiales bacterium]|nr:SurA N-terminal domain-containing protein [Nevskiales bacterium]
MLQNIRERATGPIAWVVIGLLIVGFSLWGIESYFTTPPNPKLAEVGGVEITRAELQRAYDQRYQRLQALLGENFRHDMIDPAAFRRGVLDELVQAALLEQYVASQRYSVSDTQVLEYIKSIPAFQVDGSFSPEAYRAALAREGLRASAFENDVRSSLQVEQMRSGLLESAIVTAKDVETLWRLERQQREATLLVFDVTRYLGATSADEAAVAARYERDKAAYMTPERLRVDYLELDRSKLAPAGAPETELLRALYEAEKASRFSRPEQRQARHILVQVNEQTSDAQAREKAEALRAQLDKGADFAALAQQHSDDPGSKARGGLLDPVTRGTLDPAFEQALFGLKPGETSAPVRTAFGWHLIRAERIEPEQVKPFTDPAVRAEVLALYREREIDERYRQMAEKLDELSFEHPDSLQPVAQALGLPVQSSDWLTRNGGPGIGAVPEVIETAFSDAVLKDKVNSAPVKAGANRLIVLRVATYEPARQRPLAEVRGEIAEQLRQESARARAQAEGEKALAALRQGRPLAEVASAVGLAPRALGFVGRRDANLPPAAQAELFRMPRPAAGQASYSGIALPDGGYAVLVLTAVQDGNVATMNAEDREAQVQALSGRLAGSEFAAFKRALEQDIKVKINESQL